MKTNFGGTFVQGVEYGNYPLPASLLKIMKREWAEGLVLDGHIRFGNLETYRQWENPVLGDLHEGYGQFMVNGHPYDVDSMSCAYAWCSSTPLIAKGRISILAKAGGYDRRVNVREPSTLIHRVFTAIERSGRKLHLHCDGVIYDRGANVDRAVLNSQGFHFNIFQKSPRFAPDCEYRFSLASALGAPSEPYIDLQIGCCADIMDIEGL